MKNKFKPSDLKNFKENDFENLTFDEQKELVSKDLDRRESKYLGLRSKDSAFRSKERMQKQWSVLLMFYLVIFTIAMFTTLWFNGKVLCFLIVYSLAPLAMLCNAYELMMINF